MRVHATRSILALGLLLITASISLPGLRAQTRQLVWSDEFNGTTIDRSVWRFGNGSTNDNIHYFTDRLDNAQLLAGKLQIVARKESYMGFDYTSALLQTRNVVDWQHGRIEARIKMPAGAGFVPAFWMMPADDMYGWWPCSGEIDIVEHPTTEVNKVYGTAHARAYSYFTGTAPKSATLQVSDVETAFHVYAIEWSGEQIAFYVDQTKYFTVTNDHLGTQSWPFNQPFYIILDLAVGGGWVGTPGPTTVFPALMEVDYVRVYQDLQELQISGKDFVPPSALGIPYSVPPIAGATYTWSVPATAHIASGQGTRQVAVNWGNSGGNISVVIAASGSSATLIRPVVVTNNLLHNSGFEKGVKYWNSAMNFPAKGTLDLDSTAHVPGSHWMKGIIATAGANPWDAQITQSGFGLVSGKQYEGTFRAKADMSGRSIKVSVINAQNYYFYGGGTFVLSDVWKEYTFRMTATQNASGLFTIDLGLQAGTCYLDDISLVDLSTQTGISMEDDAGTPGAFSLSQNYPNPFNPATTIRVAVPVPAWVTIKVYSLLGEHVATLVDGQMSAGTHNVSWMPANAAAGVYYYRMQSGSLIETRKLLLLK